MKNINYSVLLSEIDANVVDAFNGELSSLLKKEDKVVIIPWALPYRMNKKEFDEYYGVGSKKYEKIMEFIRSLKTIESENIVFMNQFSMTRDEIKQFISKADVLLMPGVNPEMLYQMIVQDYDLLYEIKYFKGIIIGSSAGSIIQQKRYFINSNNNFYKYFACYDGFGLINNDFYIDVHTMNNSAYQKELQEISDILKTKMYAIHNDGAIIINRDTRKLKLFGNVDIINCRNVL